MSDCFIFFFCGMLAGTLFEFIIACIIIYAVLNAFLKIFDIFLHNVHLEYEISEVLKDFKNGLWKV